MNEIANVADFIGKLGPTGLLGAALFVLARKYAALEAAFIASQEARVKAAQDYAQEKRADSKENTQALLAVADRTAQAIDRFEAQR